MSRIVIALGGNALALPRETVTISSQFQHAKEALAEVAKIARDQHEIVLTHGNGPQVGAILIRSEAALEKTYRLPLEVCVAESEGELGYVLEQSLYNALHDAHVSQSVASLLTQVVVNKDDAGFQNPTKPIGPFYTKEQAETLRAQGMHIVEDAGRGYRQVVASPEPLEVVEAETIRKLLPQNIIVIAAGGGGIPVIRNGAHLEGVPAVIDKDRASMVLASQIGAEILLILTGVQYAYTDFGKPSQTPLHTISPATAEKLLTEGHFADGSMKPKIEAAIAFVQSGGKRAIITDPAHAFESLTNPEVCTTIVA